MTIDISTFRAVAANDGYIRSDGENNVRLRGTGLFGKVSEWFQGFKSTENQNVRTNFVATLKSTYGTAFVNSAAVQSLLGHTESSTTQTRLLSARVVRDLLTLGDNELLAQEAKKNDELLATLKNKIHASVPTPTPHESQKPLTLRAGDRSIHITSSYPNTEELKASAQRFAQHAQLGHSGSALLNAMSAHLNNPNDASLSTLTAMPGHEAALGFVRAFTLTPEMTSIQGQMNNVQTKSFHVGTSLIDATAGILQTSTRTTFLAAELAKTKNAAEAGHKANEILDVTASQIKKTEAALNAIANRHNFQLGLTIESAKKLDILRTGLEDQLHALRDPNGIFQGFRAFASDIALNPVAGYDVLQEMLQPSHGQAQVAS